MSKPVIQEQAYVLPANFNINDPKMGKACAIETQINQLILEKGSIWAHVLNALKPRSEGKWDRAVTRGIFGSNVACHIIYFISRIVVKIQARSDVKQKLEQERQDILKMPKSNDPQFFANAGRLFKLKHLNLVQARGSYEKGETWFQFKTRQLKDPELRLREPKTIRKTLERQGKLNAHQMNHEPDPLQTVMGKGYKFIKWANQDAPQGTEYRPNQWRTYEEKPPLNLLPNEQPNNTPLWKANYEHKKAGTAAVGIAYARGRRPAMEDAHLATTFELMIGKTTYPVQLFGIFDGHRGRGAAHFVCKNLVEKLKKWLLTYNSAELTDEGIWYALKMAFVELNDRFKGGSGTTATVAMVLDGKLWTANVGDSRTVLDNGGTAEQLTEDADPSMRRYRKGVEKRGGYVVKAADGLHRVNKDIAMARAIGDHRHKSALSARPKIAVKPLSD